MKRYKDKTKQQQIDDIMQNRRTIDYRGLDRLKKDGIIEDYDVVRILSEHFREMYMFYFGGVFNLITQGRQLKELDEELLWNRRFLLSRCITNGVQDYYQRYGIERFEELSFDEKLDVILNQSRELLKEREER